MHYHRRRYEWHLYRACANPSPALQNQDGHNVPRPRYIHPLALYPCLQSIQSHSRFLQIPGLYRPGHEH